MRSLRCVIPGNHDSKNGTGTKKPIKRFGFYGCHNQVVCLEHFGVRGPQNLRVKCTACGHEHVVHPFWRKPVNGPLDAGREGILVQSDAVHVESGS